MRFNIDDDFIKFAMVWYKVETKEIEYKDQLLKNFESLDISNLLKTLNCSKEDILNGIVWYFKEADRALLMEYYRDKAGEIVTELSDVVSVANDYNICPGCEIYELVYCDDEQYRIFPMTVKQVVEYGSVRDAKEPVAWNIYAENDYCKGYYSYYDIGNRIFTDKDKAIQMKKELEGKAGKDNG